MNEDERKQLVRYRFNKAQDTFQEVDVLIENSLWNTVVNRMYYASYYAITALLPWLNQPLQIFSASITPARSRDNNQ